MDNLLKLWITFGKVPAPPTKTTWSALLALHYSKGQIRSAIMLELTSLRSMSATLTLLEHFALLNEATSLCSVVCVSSILAFLN